MVANTNVPPLIKAPSQTYGRYLRSIQFVIPMLEGMCQSRCTSINLSRSMLRCLQSIITVFNQSRRILGAGHLSACKKKERCLGSPDPPFFAAALGLQHRTSSRLLFVEFVLGPVKLQNSSVVQSRIKMQIHRAFESRLPANDTHPYRTCPWRPQSVEYDAWDLDVEDHKTCGQAIPVRRSRLPGPASTDDQSSG